MIEIRAETAVDIPAIHHINTLAFGRMDEADLVNALRQRGAYTISLVAVMAEQVVGHVFFTSVAVVGEGGAWTAVALGPVAILPDCQNQGIGTQLIEAGLRACRARGDQVVAVLGHADYYPRFGFRPSVKVGIRSEFEVPDEVFMLLELEAGALAGRTGVVKYQPEFSNV
jgi:putative acetyltransferase